MLGQQDLTLYRQTTMLGQLAQSPGRLIKMPGNDCIVSCSSSVSRFMSRFLPPALVAYRSLISGGRSSDKAIFRSWSDDPTFSDHRTFWILEAKLSDDRFKISHLEAIMSLHRFNFLSWRQIIASSFPFFQHLLTMSLHRQWWSMSMSISMSRPWSCPCLC